METLKKKKIREGINNPLLFMAVVSGEILSVENEIEKCRKVFAMKAKDYGTSWRILRLPSLTDQIFITV